MNRNVDEAEHSLEMHIPYIKKVLPNVKLVPIMVGNLNAKSE
jgi:AmmeMemoRadiSam system protein B